MPLLFAVYHNVKNYVEKNSQVKIFNENLKTVTVDGKKMSCYVQGDGSTTIILLSGYATPSPIANFMPLSNALSQNYKVVTLEYFGYGFSDPSKEIRSNESFVHEIRSALKELGIQPPYVLMPHSFSGIYSMYYANKYPDEVFAIIGLDDSKPNQMKGKDSFNKSLWDKIKSFFGTYRIIDFFNPNYMEDMFFKGIDKTIYSEDLLKLMHEDFVWHYNSSTSVNEENMMYKNASDLFDVKYPENLPVLSILCSKNAKNETLNWVPLHEEVFSNPDIQKLVILEGRHYIHYTQIDSIVNLTNEFLKKYNV